MTILGQKRLLYETIGRGGILGGKGVEHSTVMPLRWPIAGSFQVDTSEVRLD